MKKKQARKRAGFSVLEILVSSALLMSLTVLSSQIWSLIVKVQAKQAEYREVMEASEEFSNQIQRDYQKALEHQSNQHQGIWDYLTPTSQSSRLEINAHSDKVAWITLDRSLGMTSWSQIGDGTKLKYQIAGLPEWIQQQWEQGEWGYREIEYKVVPLKGKAYYIQRKEYRVSSEDLTRGKLYKQTDYMIPTKGHQVESVKINKVWNIAGGTDIVWEVTWINQTGQSQSEQYTVYCRAPRGIQIW